MKKIIFSSLILLSISAGFVGCVKDTGFDNQQYGIKDPAGQPVGISFPWASTSEPTLISINPSTTAQTVEAPTVNLEADQPAPTDLHVNLVAKPSLVAAYNAANGTNWLAMPATNYTIPSLKVTIKKGERLSALKITVSTTTGLSFSDIYGFGFSIASIDEAGYTIPSNLKDVLIGINVANAYAATYKVTGYFFHPSAPRAINMYKDITTVSATRSRTELGDLGGAGYIFEFDVSGTSLTNWGAVSATPSGTQSGFMTADNPGGTVYASPVPGTSGWVSTTYNNTYNGSNTFYMHYGYAAGGNGQNTYTRQVYEKFVRQ